MAAKGCEENWPKVDIVLLNWNAWHVTERSLGMLSRLQYPNYEVILVDNASTETKPEGFGRTVSDLIFVQTGANLGYTGGNNAGIRIALQRNADFILVLNNDVLVEDPSLLTKLVSLCRDMPWAGIVAPRILQYNFEGDQIKESYYGRAQALLSCLIGDQTLNRSTSPSRLQHPTQSDTEIEHVTQVCGCAMLIPRHVLERVGCFDERLFMYDDEYDLCLRVRDAGFQVTLLNNTSVSRLNVCSQSNMPAYRTYLLGRNRFLVASKMKHPFRFVVLISFHIISSIKLAGLLLRHRRWRQLRSLLVGFRDGLFFRWGITPQLRILLHS